MGRTYTLYGVTASNLDEAAKIVERLLGVTFVARNGYHMGGDYFDFRDVKTSSGVVLKENILEDDEIHELKFPDEKIILYIDNYAPDSPFNRTLEANAQIFRKLREETLPG